MTDWADKPEFRTFAEEVLRETVPAIADSSYFIAIAPEGGTADVKIAVEIGFALLLDKPLILVAPKGRHIAERLRRIADHVIEGDLENDREAIAAKLKEVMRQ